MISFFSRLLKKSPSPAPEVNTQKPKTDAPSPTTTQSFGKELVQLAKNGDGKEKAQACQRIGQLLDNGEITLVEINAHSDNTEQALYLCSYSYTAASQLLATVTDQNTLAQLANDAATAQVRKAAAEKVTERSALEAMLKGAKGKDKNIYKIAKTGLAVFKAEDEALKEQQAQLDTLIQDAERHAKKAFDHLYAHKFTQLETDWGQQKAVATPAQTTRFDAAIAKCQTTIDAEIAKARAASEAEATTKLQLHAMEMAQKELVHLAAKIYEQATLSADDATLFNQQIDDLAATLSAAQTALGDNPQGNNLARQFKKAEESLRELLQQLLALGTLASNLAALNDSEQSETRKRQLAQLISLAKDFPQLHCEAVTNAEAAIQEWQQQQDASIAAKKALIADLSDLCRRAAIAASSGQIRRARGIYRELREKREGASDLPQGLANKLEELDATMSKLEDWHKFAVTPKKEALIEEMTQLQSSSLAPDDLADKIHDLQEQWKVLCKGGENQDEALWQAFQNAAEKAFEPCKTHFAEQAKLREENAQHRFGLIAQLEQYYNAYNWDKAVWKDVEQTLNTAKEAWKSFWPVPRTQQKDIQAAFDATLDKIHEKMNAAYDAAKTQKEQLIALAQKAAQHTDPKVAAEDIKQLQNQWKSAGRTYRKVEQQLWAQFRATCDQVFAKRQELFDELRAEKDQIVQQANSFIEKLTELAQQAGAQLQTQGSVIDEIKDAFQQLAEVPKAEFQKFEKTLKNIEQKIARHRSASQQQIWLDLFSLHNELNHYELTQLDETTREQLAEKIAQQKLPAQCQEILKARLFATEKINTENTVTALKLLCIRAEILADKESPESDRALRMQYQVQSLKENFGTAQGDSNEQLAREWITHRGCPTLELQQLSQRFLASTFQPAPEPEAA